MLFDFLRGHTMCCGAAAEVEVRRPASCGIRPGNYVVAVDGGIEIAWSLHLAFWV
jgi:hypothetical protein